jgi:hypothetical protein
MSDRTHDRLDIAELLHRYAWAVGDRDWAAWHDVFAPDARVDYSTAGGVVGTPAEARGWLEVALGGFDVTVNHTGNLVVDFDDDNADRARARSLYRVTMRLPGDPPTYLEACGWYLDQLVRTADGWRIAERVEQLAYLR